MDNESYVPINTGNTAIPITRRLLVGRLFEGMNAVRTNSGRQPTIVRSLSFPVYSVLVPRHFSLVRDESRALHISSKILCADVDGSRRVRCVAGLSSGGMFKGANASGRNEMEMRVVGPAHAMFYELAVLRRYNEVSRRFIWAVEMLADLHKRCPRRVSAPPTATRNPARAHQ